MKTAYFSIVVVAIVAVGIFFSSCRKIKMGKCCDEEPTYFFENDSSNFVLPNIFTPNGDGVNDIWKGLAQGVQSYHISLYKSNLFKTKVFESTNIFIGWDGTHKGKPATEGVYKYSVNITLQGGQSYTYEGTVCLVRKEIIGANCRNCKFAMSGDQLLCK